MDMDSRMYDEARKRVKKKKDFYGHLTTYVIVGIFFFVLNMLTNPFDWWFYWPMLGWGIGLSSHYFSAFGLPGADALDDDWEEREIQREMRRLEHQTHYRKPLPEATSTAAEEDELELKDYRQYEQKIKNQADKENPARRKWDDSELV